MRAARHLSRPTATLLLAAWLATGCATVPEEAPVVYPSAADSAEQTPAEPDADQEAVREVEEEFPAEADEAAAREWEEGGDKCSADMEGQPIQEQSQEVIRSMSCYTFRWFDHLWGSEHDFKEEEISGRVIFGAEQTQYDGFDPRLRLRVRASLPNLSRRWDLLLGRVDEESYISDTQGQDATFYNPGVIDRGDDPGWLLGLGHRGKERKRGWDYSVGVRLRLPPRPYVKAQWYYNKDFSERTDFRFRQTFFWRIDQGFGTTSRGDLATAIDPKNVLRWEGIATVHEETEGTEWYFGQTWYHLFANQAAISLQAFANGETGDDVPLQDYGFRLIWRKPWTREWIYLSVGPSITWPRQDLDEQREMSLGIGVWVEMLFGNWQW